MNRSLTRRFLAVLAPMIFCAMPLSLVGCGEEGGGAGGDQPKVDTKKVEEAHKDSMAEFKRQMEKKTAAKK